MAKKIDFRSLFDQHSGKEFLVCCPGKNITEWLIPLKQFIQKKNLLTLGSNKISELINLDYHMFTNNDKYEAYGNMVGIHSTLILGKNIKQIHINKHKPERYVVIDYADKETEVMMYDKQRDVIKGYYRTSGNLAIMLCHLMGASMIYVAGMSGYTYKFDGRVHYYKEEIGRDKKKKKAWKWYDNVTKTVLGSLKKHGINFAIITPTIYREHYLGDVLCHNEDKKYENQD